MADPTNITEQAEAIRKLMREKLGVRGRSFPAALVKAKRRLPRALRAQGVILARALPMAEHPKLSLTLDRVQLEGAVRAFNDHLVAIDVADRRKGFILSVLGAIAFNLLVLGALVVAYMAWRGYI